jgi:ferric-dicitrate binding protein FerR (iron transport regulator)
MDYKDAIYSEQNEIENELLLKYIKGISSDEENSRMMLWLKEDPEYERILLQTAYIYNAQQVQNRILSRNAAYAFNKVQKRIRWKRRRIYIRRSLAMAGCFALLISIGINTSFLIRKKAETQQYITMQANTGMRTDFTLPDGTKVYLNSATKLTYPVAFTAKERRVELEGEAYFKVNREAGRPFIVDLPDRPLKVKVLGTEFNIQAYPADPFLKTTLVNGSVQVGLETEQGTVRYIVLNPSQKAIYDIETRMLEVVEVNTIYDTAWMQGRLMFKDTPVPEVLNRLSHFYNVSFQVQDSLINNYTFTGIFENRQLSQILDYLSISSRIKYKIITPAEDDSDSLKRTSVILTKK